MNFKKFSFYLLVLIFAIENSSFAKSPSSRYLVSKNILPNINTDQVRNKQVDVTTESKNNLGSDFVNQDSMVSKTNQDTTPLDQFLEQFDKLDPNEFQDNILDNLDNQNDNNQEDILSQNADLINFFKNPAAMADEFPQALKEEVLSTWSMCGNAMARLFNSMGMGSPMAPLAGLLNELRAEIQDESFFSLTVKIQDIVSDTAFILKIQNKQLDQDTKKEFIEIFNNLENILSKVKSSLNKVNLSKFNNLKEIINLISQDKIPELAIYSKSENLKAKDALNSILLKLNKFLKSNQLDKKKVDAVIFWQEKIFAEFKPFLLSMDKNGNLDSSSFMLAQAGPVGVAINKILKGADNVSKFAPAILFSYGFYKKFLNYYLQDNIENKKYLFKVLLGDSAVSSLFFPIYILKAISDVKSGKIDAVSAFKALQTDVIGFYLDPNFLVDKQNWFMRSFFRVGSAYLYENNKNLLSLLDKDSWQNWLKYSWPKKSEHMNSAFWFSIKDGYMSFADYLEHQVYSKIDTKTLDAIENKTFGLVSPKLIKFAVNTFAPIGVAKAFENENLKTVANIDKKTVFGQEYIPLIDKEWAFSKYFFNPVGTGLDFLTNSDSIYYIGDNRKYADISDREYIENRLLGYVSVNIGAYFGKKVALKLKNQCGFLLSRIGLILMQGLVPDAFDTSIKDSYLKIVWVNLNLKI